MPTEKFKYIIVFFTGLTALLLQTLLFREFLAVFSGNELSIGLFFLTWMLWIIAGALSGGLFFRTFKIEKIHLLPLLYIPAFILQAFLIIKSREIAGVPAYEIFSFYKMLPVTFLINAPLSIVTGFLFVASGTWFKQDGIPPAKVYIAESIGSFTGAVSGTLLLFLGLSELSVFQLNSLLLVIVVSMYSIYDQRENSKNKKVGFPIIPVFLLILVFLTAITTPDEFFNKKIQQYKWSRIIPGGKLEGTFTTPQAEYLYGEDKNRKIIVSNNSIIETYPAIEDNAIMIAENLSQCPKAQNVLIISNGDIGLAETLAYCGNIRNITAVSTDPEYYKNAIESLFIFPDTKKIEFFDKDINDLLKRKNSYDLVLVDLPPPSSLYLNRYYTVDFIKSIKGMMKSDSVLSIYFPAGENYMGTELKLIGSSILKSLEENFNELLLRPGERSLFFATDAEDLITDDTETLISRLKKTKRVSKIFPPENIHSFYESNRIEFQMDAYRSISENYEELVKNTEENPKSYLYSLLLSSKKADLNTIKLPLINKLNNNIIYCFCVVFAVLVFFRIIYVLKNSRKERNTYLPTEMFYYTSVAAIVGIIVQISLIYRFQTAFGSLFLYFGLITSLFMLGLFCGGSLSKHIFQMKKSEGLVFVPLILNLLFLFLVYRFSDKESLWGFAVSFFFTGFIAGLYFPIAAGIFEKNKFSSASTASILDTADHLGGAIGGFAVSFILIPFAGLLHTVTAASILIISSLIPLVLLRNRKIKRFKIPFERFNSILKFTIAGLMALIIILGCLLYTDSGSKEEKTKRFLNQFSSRNYATLERKQVDISREIGEYFEFRSEENLKGFIFFAPQGVEGFSGPLKLIIAIDSKGKLMDFEVIEHNETPNYFIKAMTLKNKILGLNILSPEPFKDVDSITGATITSDALKKVISTSSLIFKERCIDWNREISELDSINTNYKSRAAVYWFITALIILLLLRKTLRNSYLRFLRLVLIFSIFGFCFNFQYSTNEVLSLFKGNFSLNLLSRSFVMVLLIPASVLILFNCYCGFLCPFGAIQELATSISKKTSLKLFPGQHTWRLFSNLKYIILLFFVISIAPAIIKFDILQKAFAVDSSLVLLITLIWFTLCSFLFPRFWCRIFCPTGAFLSLLRMVSPFRIMNNKVIPAKCTSGICSGQESDCLCCDRCVIEKSEKVVMDKKFAFTRNVLIFIAAFIISLSLLFILLAEKKVDNEIVGKISNSDQIKNDGQKVTQLPLQTSSNDENPDDFSFEENPTPKKENHDKKEERKNSEPPPRTTHEIDKKKYMELIREGKLSDKKAMYYKKE